MVAALRSTGALLCYASLILFSLFVSTTSALSAAGQRVLVVLSPSESKSQYSTFFGDLEARGFQISYRDISSGPALEEYDERSFDHLVWLGEGIDCEYQRWELTSGPLASRRTDHLYLLS